VRWIAQRGGFLARRGDGEPGVKTLGRGDRRLEDLTGMGEILHPRDHDVDARRSPRIPRSRPLRRDQERRLPCRSATPRTRSA
jgi:hypothetical protein